MPSPVHKTNYASEALTLLTSRYSQARPFTPQQLAPLLWLRGDFGLSTSAWIGKTGYAATAPNTASDPTVVSGDANFAGANTARFAPGNVLDTGSFAMPPTSAITVVVVASRYDGSGATVTIFTGTETAMGWTVIPSQGPELAGLRVAELIVAGRAMTSDEIAGMKTYATGLYGALS